MNCLECADALDRLFATGPGTEESPALRHSIADHTAGCAECRAALAATDALAADRMPTFATALDPGLTEARQTRRLRPAALVLAIGLGGAAFAAASWISLQRLAPGWLGAGDTEAAGTELTGGQSPDSSPGDALIEQIAAAERTAAAAASARGPDILPDGEYFQLLNVPPRYPEDAARDGLEGEAVTEFTITAEGRVDDAAIVRSSDARFEAASIEAASQIRYKPRVVDGIAVPVSGVRMMWRYRLSTPAPAAAAPADGEPRVDITETQSGAPPLDAATYRARLASAYGCLDRDDLRCIELILDELAATYSFSPAQAQRIAVIYGYIHHRRGRYQLAIDAYRRAAAVRDPDRANAGWPLRIVANIHFEQQQYQESLDAMLEYVRSIDNPTENDFLFIDKLRTLGAVVR